MHLSPNSALLLFITIEKPSRTYNSYTSSSASYPSPQAYLPHREILYLLNMFVGQFLETRGT
ncbi:hypothetical protein [Metallosphaera javensis (ex Sakai et al. 2022)]|uniref:hypothetical protein n=1 Tax=Metallosphaera javensis (ex Sakai et al. 2022) TaxID=2775498 RepID=UPI00258FCA24|nr:MAG: hypothetical protein MjAS7_1692 [Metallosphaera javensis (ex Sakai et al. 2022)]